MANAIRKTAKSARKLVMSWTICPKMMTRMPKSTRRRRRCSVARQTKRPSRTRKSVQPVHVALQVHRVFVVVEHRGVDPCAVDFLKGEARRDRCVHADDEGATRSPTAPRNSTDTQAPRKVRRGLCVGEACDQAAREVGRADRWIRWWASRALGCCAAWGSCSRGSFCATTTLERLQSWLTRWRRTNRLVPRQGLLLIV